MSHHRRIPTPVRSPSRPRRLRRHALAVAAVSVLLSQALVQPAAHAAALGSLRVHSAQGQALQAEVELRDVGAGEGEGLSLALASPQTYAAAGLTYPVGAEGLQLQLERRTDGRYVARLRSQAPVGDTFIDLLLELRGPAGTATRAYTVLLAAPPRDPAMALQPEAGAAPLVQAATPEPATPQPADAAGPAAARRAKPAAPAGGSYTVRRGDHLYGIARELVQQGMVGDQVSLDQMVVALYRANRDAFIAGNMNRLKAGAVLSLPSAQQAGAIAGPEARREVVAHTRAFDAYRNRLADAAAAMQVQPQSGQQQRGQITARVRDAAVPEQARDELRLSKPEAGAVGPKGSPTEAEVARTRQLREAEARLSQLRKNVDDMQRLLEMKSAELATLDQGAPQQPGASPASAAAATGAQGAQAAAAAVSPASAASAPAAAPLQASASWSDALLRSPWALPGGGVAIALLGGYLLYRRQRRSLASPAGATPAATATGADILAGAPVALTGLSLPLDAFPAPAGDLSPTAPPSVAQGPADADFEADAIEQGGPGSAAAVSRPLAFDLGGISLDLDAGDTGNAGDAGGRPAKASPDIMAPPDTPPRP